uniref:Uncharacterized protein n=1 Tax=Onchocerca volvulus TaxID=6282 RepID=A0A8R1TNG9_ONCVO
MTNKPTESSKMIAHTWKFAEMKEILFLLLLISPSFIAINGAPVTKKMKFTPKELANRFTDLQTNC